MSRADNFLLTAEELRLRRQKRRRWLFAAIVLVLVLVLGVFGARPASHAIKAWQARRHAWQAFEFITAERWNEAQKEATAAYQLAPNEPEATRAVARFLSRVRQPQALEFWERLATQQPLTRDDLRDEAAVALALGETGHAAAAIGSLMAHDGRDAATADWLLAAQLAAQRGAPNESAEALQHVFKEGAANSRDRLQAAVLELGVSAGGADQDQKNQADAWGRIEQLAEGKDAAGLTALVLLAQRALSQKPAVTDAQQRPGFQNGNAETLKSEVGDQRSEAKLQNSEGRDSTFRNPHSAISNIAKALEAHPLAQASQKLLAIDLRMRASPNEKAAFIQAAVDRWKDAEVKSQVALATWLNGHGEYQRELDTISMARAVQDKDLFLQRLDALGALAGWEEIKQALNSESFPLEPMISHMYLARCNAQLGEKAAGENNWQRALEAGGSDAGKLMTLADYAEKNGATSIAASAYDAAIASVPKLRAAWQGKLRLAQVERDTKKIHAVLAEMLKIWPNDTAIQNDEAYTRLLLLTGKAGSEQKTESGRNAAEGEAGLSNLKSETGRESDGGTRAVASESVQSASQLSAVSFQLSKIEALAADLVRREPASLPHRTLLALARLRAGHADRALDAYGIEVPQNVVTPSAIAVRAAALDANGRHEEAADLIRDLPRSALLPEEQALIGGL
jgi:hypothetical protein